MLFISKKSIWFTLVLSMAVALGPLATDMYLPSFPQLGQFFHVSPSSVQWTLSVFMIGLAAVQLLVGPVSDRFGRKRVLLIGLVIFSLASYMAGQASSIEMLMIARILQSVGVCTAIVIPRAMVRDLFEREEAAKKLSLMGSFMGLAPAIAPILGGYLTVHYGWGIVFDFQAIYGGVIAVIICLFIKESLSLKDSRATQPKQIIANYKALLTTPVFMGYALTGALCFAGFFSYISSSSYVLIHLMNVPVDIFGYYFGFVVIGFIVGTLIGPRVTSRFGLEAALRFGTVFPLIGGSILMSLTLMDILHPLAIVLPMVVYNMGVGMVMPQSQAAAIHPFPEKAGAAAALTGCLLLGLAALTAFLVAHFYTETPMPMVIAVFTLGLMAFLCCRMKVNSPEPTPLPKT